MGQDNFSLRNTELTYKIKQPTDITNKVSIDPISTGTFNIKTDEENDPVKKAQIRARKIIEQAQTYSMYFMKSTADRVKAEFDEKLEQKQVRAVSMQEKRGYQDGYKKGYEQGLAIADNECEKTIKFLQTIIEGIDEGKELLLTRYGESLKNVALSMARIILKQEIEVNSKTMKTLIENAASACKNQDSLTITVSPETKKLLEGEEYDIKRELSDVCQDVKIISDRTFKKGDCIIETPNGVIDCGIETQLDNMQEALKDFKTTETA